MRLSLEKLLGLFKRSLTPGRPYHVQWFLTRRCNYRCRTCDVWRDQQRIAEISTDEIKRGLDTFRKLGVIEIVLTGGNPLLREDIGEIIEYASRFFITTVYDNGSMALQKIETLRKADFVAISLDSLNEKKNDYMRGVVGATRKAIKAIIELQRQGISVGVAPTISRANIYEMTDFTNYFTSRGVPIWYAIYSYDSPTENRLFGIGHKSDEFEFSNGAEVAKFCATLMDLKKKRRGIFMPNKVLITLQKLFAEKKRTWKCKALQSFFMVDEQGKIASCHYYPSIANISNILEMWDTQEFEKLRRFYSECTQCTYLCYIFYSLYSDIFSNINLIRDQAKNSIALWHVRAREFAGDRH